MKGTMDGVVLLLLLHSSTIPSVILSSRRFPYRLKPFQSLNCPICAHYSFRFMYNPMWCFVVAAQEHELMFCACFSAHHTYKEWLIYHCFSVSSSLSLLLQYHRLYFFFLFHTILWALKRLRCWAVSTKDHFSSRHCDALLLDIY